MMFEKCFFGRKFLSLGISKTSFCNWNRTAKSNVPQRPLHHSGRWLEIAQSIHAFYNRGTVPAFASQGHEISEHLRGSVSRSWTGELELISCWNWCRRKLFPDWITFIHFQILFIYFLYTLQYLFNFCFSIRWKTRRSRRTLISPRKSSKTSDPFELITIC